jgi:hypothetical protein
MTHFFRKQAGRNLVLLPETPQKLLLAQPTLADIKHRFPKRSLDLMAPTQLAGLAARFSQVDEIKKLALEVPQVTELAYQLKSEGLDINLDILKLSDEVVKGVIASGDGQLEINTSSGDINLSERFRR